MGKMVLNVRADDTLRKAVIRLDEGEKPLGVVFLDAVDLEDHIFTLARIRSGLKDQVTPALERNARILAVPNPTWQLQPSKDGKAVVLALRHPGFGWVSFQFDMTKAEHLVLNIADLLPR